MFSAVPGTELTLWPLKVSVCPSGMELISGQGLGRLPEVTCEHEGTKAGQPGLWAWGAHTQVKMEDEQLPDHQEADEGQQQHEHPDYHNR